MAADAGRVDHPTATPWNRRLHEIVDGALAAVARGHDGDRLVDIGHGLEPREALVAPHVNEHVGVDHAESPLALTSVGVLAEAHDIPLALLACNALARVYGDTHPRAAALIARGLQNGARRLDARHDDWFPWTSSTHLVVATRDAAE